jgi:mono/diheme cytochrome c family protein
MRMLFLAAAIAVAPGMAFAQQAQQAGDAVRGHTLAAGVCAACHSIEAGAAVVAPSPNHDAPTFVSVANTPGMTATALTAFIYTPHHLMPDLVIPPDDARDLIAYILSLKKVPPI